MKMKPCRYCGELTQAVFGYPPVCDSPQCNDEDREREIEQNERAREAAEADNYGAYGGSGW